MDTEFPEKGIFLTFLTLLLPTLADTNVHTHFSH